MKPTKVWLLVCAWSEEEIVICGIYSTQAKAERAQDKAMRVFRDEDGSMFSIEEWDVK